MIKVLQNRKQTLLRESVFFGKAIVCFHLTLFLFLIIQTCQRLATYQNAYGG